VQHCRPGDAHAVQQRAGHASKVRQQPEVARAHNLRVQFLHGGVAEQPQVTRLRPADGDLRARQQQLPAWTKTGLDAQPRLTKDDLR